MDRFEVLDTFARGPMVINERIDYFSNFAINTWRGVGVFFIRDNKIVDWYDNTIEMEQAYRASGVQTIILRAGNFIDPERNGDVFSLVTLTNSAKPKITSLGDPAATQSWVWMPDWAKAAAELRE